VDDQTPDAGPTRQVGEGADRFSHSGERFILGYGADFFGIWDRNVAGGPAARFPRTDEGWTQAWNQYTVWEPRFVEVTPEGTLAEPSRSGEVRPTAGLARAVSILVGITGAFALLTTAARLGLIARLNEFQSGQTSLSSVQNASDSVDLMAVVTVILLASAGIVWLVWQYRAQSNLQALGVRGLRFKPGWVVAWWLIPFASFVMPLFTMSELWRASDPHAGAIEWKMRPRTPLLGFWWAFFIARIPLGAVAEGLDQPPPLTPDQAIDIHYVAIAQDLALVAAAALAVVLVRRIEERLRQKSAAVAPAMETA
jgi:hypothetical protein